MKRAYISLFPAIAIAAMTLAACGNSNNSNNGSGESEPTTGVESVESDSSAASGISEGGSGTGLFTDILDGIKDATVLGEGIEEDGSLVFGRVTIED